MRRVETEISQHLKRLCVDIGARPGGSVANRVAAEYIHQGFASYGLEVEEQSFPSSNWEALSTTLEIDGRPHQAVANAFSPSCQARAPFVAVSTVAELEAADLAGRIGVLYGDLTKDPLSPKSWFLKSEREDHIIQLLEAGRPAALLTVQARAGELPRLIEDNEFTIPSATVPASVGLELLAQPDAHLRLQIDTRQSSGATANIVARKRSQLDERQPASKIVFCAHYDTKFDTPGALDNGGGVAILLALAHILSQGQFAAELEWVAFANEEYLPIGDDEYVRCDPEQFPRILTAINFDGAGQYLGANSLTMLAHSPAYQELLAGLAQAYSGLVWVDPWPESNHSTFAWRGVPSLAFTTAGGALIHHTRQDTIDWVSPKKLAEIVSLVVDLVKALEGKTPAWCREPAVAA